MHDYLKQQKGSILNWFDKAGITEAINSANKVFAKIGSLFTEKQML